MEKQLKHQQIRQTAILSRRKERIKNKKEIRYMIYIIIYSDRRD